MRELDTFAVLYSKEANLKRGKINVFISGGYMGQAKPEAGPKDNTSSVRLCLTPLQRRGIFGMCS